MRKLIETYRRAVMALAGVSPSSNSASTVASVTKPLVKASTRISTRSWLKSMHRLLMSLRVSLLVSFLVSSLSMILTSSSANAETPRFAQVNPRTVLSFPRDFGAHPDFRTEWWYVTGWLQSTDGKPIGFQVTFFRSATEHEATNPSQFAPKQLIVAHAAISDPAIGKLQHDQRVARAGFGLAQTSESTTDIKLGKWSMRREANGMYRVTLPARDFSFDL
ncbi:MAG: AttH component of AttEFGH transport system, partial [Pseudomonadota bacterium]